MAKKDRVGEVFVSNEGCEFVVVEYNNCHDVWIEFCDENKARVHTSYQCCQNGEIKNPYHPSVYGKGYLGLLSDGTRPKVYIDGKMTREYDVWHSMVQRCYDEKFHETHPTYKDCTLEEELHCFAFFLEQVIRNIPNYEYWLNHPNERVALDKDIKGNSSKIYSRDTIMFVTQSENVKEMIDRCGNPIESMGVYGVHVKTGEKTKVFNSLHDVERELSINRRSVSKCINNKLKTAGGYKWFKVE